MPGTTNTKWLTVLSGIIIAAAFFLPWVDWAGIQLNGAALPYGHFFAVSEEKFNLANPFPQFNIALLLFWLTPVLALITVGLAFSGKNTSWTAALTGLLALSQVAVYILFTKTLVELGVGKSLPGSLRIGLYATVLGALGIIIAGVRGAALKKLGLIIIGPVAVWVGFMLIAKHLEGKKFDDSANMKADYTLNGLDMIREFRANDSAANAKYREKIILVNGRATETELPNDSTVNIRITDSTGSYVIFTFNDPYVKDAKTIKPGDSISVKGSCSGGIYSDILETETISFKRCAIIKQ